MAARWGTAVVVGGSVAGCFAARVLADHFERVVVFDRDDLPDAATARRGAPHAVHFHALLARGRRVAEELLPGFDDDLLGSGAVRTNLSEARVYEPYGWAPTAASTRSGIGASRLLIEAVIRRRAMARPGVEVRPRAEVVELVATSDGRQVTGVRVRALDGSDVVGEQAADLVVDASGRTSPILSWLQALGSDPPAVTTVNAHWGYASRFLHLPAGAAPPAVGGFPIGAASDGPPATRGGFLLAQEDDLWLVTLSGCAKDFPPDEEEGFIAFARSLAFDDIADALALAEPLTPIRRWRNTVNRWRHLESLPWWPAGFACMADAVCSFNPVYGQGMTVAALEALDLQTELEASASSAQLADLGRRFQSRIATTLRQPWEAASRSDLRVPGVEGGPPPPGFREHLELYDRVVALGRDDPAIYERIAATNQLVISAEWIEDPALRARVIADWERLGAMMGSAAPRPSGAP